MLGASTSSSFWGTIVQSYSSCSAILRSLICRPSAPRKPSKILSPMRRWTVEFAHSFAVQELGLFTVLEIRRELEDEIHPRQLNRVLYAGVKRDATCTSGSELSECFMMLPPSGRSAKPRWRLA